MKVWRFSIKDDKVEYGDKQRPKLHEKGCNEPFKGRYWCPKMQWFRIEPCPFLSLRECENYLNMCGAV